MSRSLARPLCCRLAAAALLVALPAAAGTRPPPVDHLLDELCSSTSAEHRSRVVDRLLQQQPSFAQAMQWLARERSEGNAARTGRHLESVVVRGQRRPYVLHVPETYDPARAYPVRVYLHGYTDRPMPGSGHDSSWFSEERQVLRQEEISVFPAAWHERRWWSRAQIEGIGAMLDRIKQRYNVDDNRIALLGFSDGGTGTFFHALLNPTPWSAFVPMCGASSALARPLPGCDATLFPANLANRPLLVINTGHDEYYPLPKVQPYLDLFERVGCRLLLRYKALYGHSLRWLADELPVIDAFLASHQRVPHPARLSWQTDDAEHFGRVQWLVITRLGPVPGERLIADENTILPHPMPPALGVELDDRAEGQLKVREVAPRYPAQTAGVRRGDIILAVAERPVTTARELLTAVEAYSFGQGFDLRLLRGSRELTVRVAMPAAAPEQQPHPAFSRRGPSGRVVAVRNGNRFELLTSGVRELQLLLAADAVDLAQPVAVICNGRQVFAGPVRPDPSVLLTWAARDNDRTMRYAAALTITVPAQPTGLAPE